MFILTSVNSSFRHITYDLDSLEDLILGLTENETEAKRVVTIAYNMKPGDVFYNNDIYLKCKEGK